MARRCIFLTAPNYPKNNAHNTGWNFMAHGWRRIRSLFLCADWKGEEMVLGDDMGRGRNFLMDTSAHSGDLLPAA
jgi:hypothetical protein